MMVTCTGEIQERNDLIRRAVIILLTFFFAGGLSAATMPATFRLFVELVPLTLLVCYAFTLLFSAASYRSYVAILVIASAGFAIEVAGVRTGMIFGSYHYGNTLGLKIFNTPVLIGISWAILVLSTAHLTNAMKVSTPVKIVAASAIMVLYDFFMEQVASRLDLWYWRNNDVPLTNYLGWFAVSLIMHTWLRMSRADTGFHLAIPLLICQSVFFAILAAFFSL